MSWFDEPLFLVFLAIFCPFFIVSLWPFLEKWLRVDILEKAFSLETFSGNIMSIFFFILALCYVWIAPEVFDLFGPDSESSVSEGKVKISRIFMAPTALCLIYCSIRKAIYIKKRDM
ncbi:MAG: hypothetical protein Q8L72_00915 [Moraxellaceae bacterium]|nr:hypothetical protein [Moraxellaceae bacterium]